MIRVPSSATLKKYGLSASEWVVILKSQGNVCAICKKVPTSGRFVTDHFHKRLYKSLPDIERKRLVRGILCVHCNRFYLAKGITVDKAQAIVEYLSIFEKRLNDNKH